MIEPNAVIADRYRVEKKLGQGGMGAVYLAIDLRFGNRVALKETLVGNQNEGLQRAFRREAALLNRLKHAALPKVIDFFTHEAAECLVMEFVPGRDLGEMLVKNGAPFPTALVLGWADRVLDALVYLHTRHPPVIHRDIKPQNIKITPEGDVVLLDFGLAKGSATSQKLTSTTASLMAGTPSYAPLEQMNGEGTDARSDLYGLAATLYSLVTNRRPTDAGVRASAVVNALPDPLLPAHLINPEVPEEVSRVIHDAMSLRISGRPASAADMRADLRDASVAHFRTPEPFTVPLGATQPAVTGVSVPPIPPSAPERSIPPVSMPVSKLPEPDMEWDKRRIGLALSLVAVVLAVAVVAGIVMIPKMMGPAAPAPSQQSTSLGDRPPPAPPPAPAALEALRLRPETEDGRSLEQPDRLTTDTGLRFRFEAPSEGRLYLVAIDPSGGYQTLLTDQPAAETKLMTNTVEANNAFVFPGSDASMRFKTGREHLVVVFALPGAPVPPCLHARAMRNLSPEEIRQIDDLVAASRDTVSTAVGGPNNGWLVITRAEQLRVVAIRYL